MLKNGNLSVIPEEEVNAEVMLGIKDMKSEKVVEVRDGIEGDIWMEED